MSSFLHTDALHHIEKHLDRFPLIKLDRILDWTPIEQYLTGRKTRYVRDNGGRPAYPPVIHVQSHPEAFIYASAEGLFGSGQSLLQIGQQVVDMFDADRQAHHVFAHARLCQFFGIKLAVGGAGGVGGQ